MFCKQNLSFFCFANGSQVLVWLITSICLKTVWTSKKNYMFENSWVFFNFWLYLKFTFSARTQTLVKIRCAYSFVSANSLNKLCLSYVFSFGTSLKSCFAHFRNKRNKVLYFSTSIAKYSLWAQGYKIQSFGIIVQVQSCGTDKSDRSLLAQAHKNGCKPH